jgi:hypothetical protein
VEADVVSKQTLLSCAQEIGVTARQLERWRKAGLLPTSTTTAHGRGKGKSATYPLHSMPLLQAIAKAHEKEKRLDSIAFRLLLASYPIDHRKVRETLLKLAARWKFESKARNKRVQAERIAAETLASPGGGFINKEVRKLPEATRFAVIEAAILMVSGGTIERNRHVPAILKGINPNLGPENREFVEDATETISSASKDRIFQSTAMRSSMEDATADELSLARQNLIQLVNLAGPLGFVPVPTDPDEALTGWIAAPFWSYITLLIHHCRRKSHIDREMFGADPASGSNQL